MQGKRLRPEALAVTVGGKNIVEVTSLPVVKALAWVTALRGNGNGNEARGKRQDAQEASERQECGTQQCQGR